MAQIMQWLHAILDYMKKVKLSISINRLHWFARLSLLVSLFVNVKTFYYHTTLKNAIPPNFILNRVWQCTYYLSNLVLPTTMHKIWIHSYQPVGALLWGLSVLPLAIKFRTITELSVAATRHWVTKPGVTEIFLSLALFCFTLLVPSL